jgi:hypothetical protein
MNKNARAARWTFFLFFLAFAAAFAGTQPVRAEDQKTDSAAEAKKEADEISKQEDDRNTGSEGGYQRQFSGTLLLDDKPQDDNPDVIGVFVTDEKDNVPQQGYKVKVAKGDSEKEILESLKRYNGKKVEVMGRLRVDNKYLVISKVIERAAPPKEPQRRSGGGI